MSGPKQTALSPVAIVVANSSLHFSVGFGEHHHSSSTIRTPMRLGKKPPAKHLRINAPHRLGAESAGKGVARSAASNVVMTALRLLQGLVVPALLIRRASGDVVDGYLLAGKIVAIFFVLDLGLTLTTTQAMAEVIGRRRSPRVHTLVVQSRRIYRTIASISVVLLVALVYFLPSIFPKIPASRLTDTRTAIAILGAATLSNLLSAPYRSVLTTYQLISSTLGKISAVRIIGSVLTIVLAGFGASITELCAVAAAVTVIVSLVEWRVARAKVLTILRKPQGPPVGSARRLWKRSLAVSLVSIANFLVNGFDVAVVNRYDYAHFRSFSLATSIVISIAGVHYAVLAPTFPEFGKLFQPEKRHDLNALVRRTVAISVSIRFLALGGLAFMGPLAVTIWVGKTEGRLVLPTLFLLTVADAIRLSDAVYTSTVLAAGRFKLLVSKSVFEGFLHIALIVALGMKFGAKGVVAANFGSALCGLAWLFIVCSRRVRREIGLALRPFFVEGLLVPAAVVSIMGTIGFVLPQTEGRYLVLRAVLSLGVLFAGYHIAVTRKLGFREAWFIAPPASSAVVAGKPGTPATLAAARA
jgi:O-antigen/teichoic acid export membrane protein